MAWHKQVCRNWLVQARRLLSTVSRASSLRALHSTTRFWPHPQHRDAEAGRECTTSSEQSYKRFEKEGRAFDGTPPPAASFEASPQAKQACTCGMHCVKICQTALAPTFTFTHILTQSRRWGHSGTAQGLHACTATLHRPPHGDRPSRTVHETAVGPMSCNKQQEPAKYNSSSVQFKPSR